MALTVFSTGDVPTATQVNNLFVNTLFVRKPSNETVTSSTALQDDDHLQLTVEANTSFEVRMLLRYAAQLADDIKISFSGPAGATFDCAIMGLDTAATAFANDTNILLAISTAVGLGGLGGTNCGAYITGLLITSGTAGTFKLQWAQNNLSGSGVSVLSGSYMVANRVA